MLTQPACKNRGISGDCRGFQPMSARFMEYHAAETVVNHYGEFSGRAGLCAQHGDGNAGGFPRGFLYIDTLKKFHALRTARPKMAALFFRSGGRDCLYRKACAHSVLFAPDTFGIGDKDVLGNLQKPCAGLRDGWGVCFCCLCRQPEVFRLLGFGSVFRQDTDGIDTGAHCFPPVFPAVLHAAFHCFRTAARNLYQVFFRHIVCVTINRLCPEKQTHTRAAAKAALRRFHSAVYHADAALFRPFGIKLGKIRARFQRGCYDIFYR